ncbi:ABC transporter permease [Parapusillimonas sp. JC17]|uniref:ABC transporter permease n=1 Tax=Parapusillimonas sp. JC17 TaxID=3445768 RepID=UPI003FA0151A
MKARYFDILLPLGTLVFVLTLWDISVRWFGVPNYLLPPPLDVFKAFWHGYSTGLLWPHLLTTAAETLLGFILGCSVALVLGGLVAEYKLLEKAVYPFVVALQSMPKVALAPLLLVWFGFGLMSKVVLVALICFFPMFVNVVSGLRSARPELIDLYTAFSATRFQIFKDIKLPSALPAIFAGLQIAIVLSLLGAVVGEFVASQQGLGSLIQAASLNFDLPTMFACIVTLALMGALATMTMQYVQRRVLFWETGSRNTTSKTRGNAA